MNHLDNLATEFFRLFSRIEYALKAAGYYQISRSRNLEANWQKFASDANESVLLLAQSDYELSEAIDFLKNFPPKKQAIVDGKIDWKESRASGVCELDVILVYVRRIRNNLFHGGKFNGHWFEPQRSELLIAHSKTILLASIREVADVSAAYHG